MHRALLGSILPGLFLAACGGIVELPPGSGGAGGSGSTSSGTLTGGGGGGTPLACGGRAGPTCSATEYCEHLDDSCGADDGQGRCLPRPGGCTEDCPGVCGCDGQFYCNACSAQQAGIDVSASASCTPGGDYTASFWSGGLDHLIVLMADPAEDRCVMLYADAPSDNQPGFDVALPRTWGVSRAEITDRAADCALPGEQPTGTVTSATGATGRLSWEPVGGIPCTLDVDVAVTTSGTPPVVRLGATGVAVDGGCL